MKKSKIILASLAGVIAISLTTMPVIAYFTAHTEAKGNVKVQLGTETTIHEEIDENDPLTKKVTIENIGKEAVFVRVKAYSAYPLDYEGAGWTKGEEDFYYYDDVLEPTQTTSELKIKVTPPAGTDTDSFNVIVVYESTRAIYTLDGPEADWSKAKTVEESAPAVADENPEEGGAEE